MGGPPLSTQEIVFWISLFGLDFGLPVVLPERWRLRVGLLATGLSLAGLVWSLGFRPTPPKHLGAFAFLTAVAIGGTSFFVARCFRERNLKLAMINVADSISAYASEINAQVMREHQNPALLHMFSMQWDGIVAKYNRAYGNTAARLAKEVADPAYVQFAKEVASHPDSLHRFTEIAEILRALAEQLPRFRTKRLIKAILQGMVSGAGAFLVVELILMFHSGELQSALHRLAGRC
jgi:hypothetical protein